MDISRRAGLLDEVHAYMDKKFNEFDKFGGTNDENE